jgi:hypothetical protein
VFDEWCDIAEWTFSQRKMLYLLTELDDGRQAIEDELVERVRSHYDELENIADDVEVLGFPAAANLLRERLPTTPRARSGEMGEILATEFVEFQTDFRIPVRRLRYKDGREMALRGDDFLGVRIDDEERLLLLKGEAKSRRYMPTQVIEEAREHLSNTDGRPTPISLLFIADRLMEGAGPDRLLGRRIRSEVAFRSVPKSRITHALFTLWATIVEDGLDDDLTAAETGRYHIAAGLCIDDHQQFIADTYEQAGNLGDD